MYPLWVIKKKRPTSQCKKHYIKDYISTPSLSYLSKIWRKRRFKGPVGVLSIARVGLSPATGSEPEI